MPVQISKFGDVNRALIRGPFKGWLPDFPPDELPPDAFSTAKNVEILRGRVRKMAGYCPWASEVPVFSVAVSEGGTGYLVDNVLTLVGTLQATGATATVTTVEAGTGAVKTVTLTTAGTGYTPGSLATTGGAGTGCTLAINQLFEVTGDTATLQAFANFEQYDGTVYGVAIGKTRAWKSEGDVWTQLTTETLVGGLATSWTSMEDLLIWTNGVDPVQQWDGLNAQAALGGSPAVCKMVAHWDDRLWLANTTEGGLQYPTRLRFSNVVDPTTGTDVNSIDLMSATDPPQFGGIRALEPLGGMLLAYLPNAVWRITRLEYEPYYQAIPIIEGIGCVNQDAICVVPEGHFFVGPTDVYFWNGAGAPTPMMAGVHNHFTSRLFPQFYGKVQCRWYREEDKVLVGISNKGAAIDTIYVYDRREGQWSVIDGLVVTCMGYLTKTDEVTWANFPGAGLEQHHATIANPHTDADLIRWTEPASIITPDDNLTAQAWTLLTWADFIDHTYERFCLGIPGYVMVLYNSNADDSGAQPGYNRNGVAYTGQVIWGHQDFGRPDLLKRVQRIMPLNLQDIDAEANALQLYVGGVDNPYQTPTWSGPYAFPLDPAIEPWIFVDVIGRYLLFRVETTVVDAPFSLSGLVVDFVVQGVR